MSQGNIYAAGAAGIFELFGEYVEGSPDCAALVLSSRRLTPEATTALDKSLAAFGYGNEACSYAALVPLDASEDEGVPLDAQAVFLLVEGIDPIMLVCTDDQATAAVAQAYRLALKADAPARVFGRSAVMFRDLDGLMGSDAGKQKAWKLLKSLPRR